MKRHEALRKARADSLGQRWATATFGEGRTRRQYVCVRDQFGRETVQLRTWEYGQARVRRLMQPPTWLVWEPVGGAG